MIKSQETMLENQCHKAGGMFTENHQEIFIGPEEEPT
jgi:hypothetical protein